jgi:NAD(P)-dependent dehydrogenase (short-subunit alcohol dehydrogenase family)
VLGAAGFLGTATVQALLDRGTKVTCLLRGQPGDSEFAFRRLFEKANVAQGYIQDAVRLRQIITLHEVDVIFQCAAGATISETHSLTRAAIDVAARSERQPPVIVPLRDAEASARVKYQAFGPSRSNVAFVRLPDLFGTGARNVERWPHSLFADAVLGRPLSPPPRQVGVCDVAVAASALADAAMTLSKPFPATGHWIDVPPQATSRELLNAVKDELGPRLFGESSSLQESVRTTLAWYRSNAARWSDRMSLQAAA